jgi:hypothetical protein
MWTLFLVIVVVALLLIACAFIDMPSWRKRAKENSEPSHIEKVREAAFAVIEASLEAEPQKWEAVCDPAEVMWVVNRKAKLAIYVGDGMRYLYVLTNCEFSGQQPKRCTHSEKLRPPPQIKARLYGVAMKIIQPSLEKQETEKLAAMVSAFNKASERSRNNDQTAA